MKTYLYYCIDMALEYSLAPKRNTLEYKILTDFYKSECKRLRTPAVKKQKWRLHIMYDSVWYFRYSFFTDEWIYICEFNKNYGWSYPVDKHYRFNK